MTPYAIVEASGRQFWVEENRFYDFNKLPLNPGDTFKINKVLLVNKHNYVEIGKPFVEKGCSVEATVIRHLSGSKVRVYKMRPKKKTRKSFGHRTKLTRVFIDSILTHSNISTVGYLQNC